MPSDIQRTRASVGGFGPSRSHSVMKTRPITLRNDSMVRTSQCAAAMILTSTSETPSTTAAATPGADEKIGTEGQGDEARVDCKSTLSIRRRRRAPQPAMGTDDEADLGPLLLRRGQRNGRRSPVDRVLEQQAARPNGAISSPLMVCAYCDPARRRIRASRGSAAGMYKVPNIQSHSARQLPRFLLKCAGSRE